jgi:hypothetical protein
MAGLPLAVCTARPSAVDEAFHAQPEAEVHPDTQYEVARLFRGALPQVSRILFVTCMHSEASASTRNSTKQSSG